MKTFKEIAEDWAEKELTKYPKETCEETACKMQEFMLLGSLIYDNNGKCIPQLNISRNLEVKPVKIINGEIILD